jgi:tetratricopeptide (TPR) repeat protein
MVSLALKRLHRYTLSNQREDLDKAIVHFTESILLPPLSWLQHRQHGPIILDILFALPCALVLRSDVYKQPKDAIYATKYLIHLRDQPRESHNIPHHRVTALLVEALSLQVELEARNLMQNIREMAVLTRELLTLNTSDVDTAHLIILIHAVVESQIHIGVPDQPLDELIECLRAARKQGPYLLKGHIAFAQSLVCRYCMTFVNDDYEEALSILDEIIIHTSGNIRDESVAKVQASATVLATVLANMRSVFYQTPEYLEEAIYRSRTSFSSSSCKEYCQVSYDPEDTAKERFKYFGSIEGVEESSGNLSLSRPAPVMLGNSQTVDDKMESLLFGIRNIDDTTKIDEAVEKGRSILASDPDAAILDFFGEILYEAFNRTKKLEYLNDSISVRRQQIEDPLLTTARLMLFPPLSQALLARFHYFPGHRTQDLDEGLELLSQYVSNAPGNFPARLRYACKWALTARRTRHPSISAAYETAMSLMQDTLRFAPTLQLQHATLVTSPDVPRSMPLDYASYQVDLGQLEKAIETLERGRALLWSQMRHLRASVDQLRQADPDLRNKFAAINRDLEELTKSIPPSHKLNMDDGRFR